MSSFLELSQAAIGYKKDEYIVEDLNLSVKEGELISFLGPSGCGKTTVLRAIAGFVDLQKGKLSIAGRDYTKVAANKRNIGMVFQSYALFPHLSVFENVAFGLRLRRVEKLQIKTRVDEALAMVGLTGFDGRLPSQLSGGQQQRVAMARAIVIEPQLLLLDEPLSNLDAKLRVELRAELKKVQRRLGVTMVYVTHDQEEALALSDRVVVMNAGKIEQIGKPEEIYQRPSTLFAAHFMGISNHLEAKVIAKDGDYLRLAAANASELIARDADDAKIGQSVTITFRPSAAELSAEKLRDDIPYLEAKIMIKTFKGEAVSYFIKTDVAEFEVEIPTEKAHYQEEDKVFLILAKEICIAFSNNGEKE